jgi:predicted acetyltransferase
MDITIRPVGDEEFERHVIALESAFGEYPSAEDIQLERTVFELGRSLAAFDGDRIVGGAGAYSMRVTVPGATVPMAGVTGVGVTPTHRRRGILTALMRRQLDDLHEGGEAVAGLWASEGSIYWRFGYGPAAYGTTMDLDGRWTRFAHPLEDEGSIELLTRADAMRVMSAVYERVRPLRPGMLERSPEWWEYRFDDSERRRGGASELFFAVRSDGRGEPDAYAAYRVEHRWQVGAASILKVAEVGAANPRAHAGIWRFLLDIDLIGSVNGWNFPVDDPLRFLLSDPQRLDARLRETLWLRLVDVANSLASRAYSVQDALTIQVFDDFCPWNEGVYRLEAGPEGASCTPTHAAPDLVTGANELAAAFLGGNRLSTLAAAGRVSEETDGALRRADALFAADAVPWCSNVF